MGKTARSWPAIALRIVVPVLILWALLVTQDLGLLWQNLRTVKPWAYTLSFILLGFRLVFGGLRSRLLLSYKGESYRVWPLTRYYFIGNFFNLFMPILVGRDLARAYFLWKTSRKRSEALSTIVIERGIGTVALSVFSLAAVAFAFLAGIDAAGGEIARWVVWGSVVVLGLFGIFMIWRGVGRLRELVPGRFAGLAQPAFQFLEHISSFNRAPGVLLGALLYSLAFQLVGIISTWLLGVALGSELSFVYYLILVPVIWLFSMLPVSLNGIGVREGAFVLLFGSVGMVREQALAIGLLWFSETVLLGLVGGFFLLGERSGLASFREFERQFGGVPSASTKEVPDSRPTEGA